MVDKKKTLIWQISSEHLPPSYLFGSIHIQDSRVLHNFAHVELLMDQCDRYAAEVNIDDLKSAVSFDSFDQGDYSLIALLGKKKYQKLQKLLEKSFQMPLSLFDNSHPMVVVQQIYGLYLVKDLPKTQDELLWDLASDKNLLKTGIETAEKQVSIFKNLDPNTSVKQLKNMIKNWSSIKESIDQLLNAYLSNDPQKIYKLSKKSAKKLKKQLIFDRNIEMADRINELVLEMPTFIAIGAGHLGGQKGVLKLLKNKNFRVKPVK